MHKILAIALLLLTIIAKAQNDSIIKLPPLPVIMETAIANSPMIKNYDKQVQFQELELKSAKSQWLSYVSLMSDYRYGNFDNINTQSGDGGAQLTNTEEFRYSVGVRFNISLYDFLGRERRIKKARNVLDQSIYVKENFMREFKGMVAEQYYRVQFNIDIFRNKVELQQLKEVQKQIAERDYSTGKIDINVLTDVLENYIRITEELQNASMQLETSFFLLEQLVGVSLNSINK